jgi:hypothetical protein
MQDARADHLWVISKILCGVEWALVAPLAQLKVVKKELAQRGIDMVARLRFRFRFQFHDFADSRTRLHGFVGDQRCLLVT